jgi:hypothetical protein
MMGALAGRKTSKEELAELRKLLDDYEKRDYEKREHEKRSK